MTLVFFQKFNENENLQKQLSLRFINEYKYPIKIDSGSFFTYDTTALSKEKFIFIVDNDKFGFIQADEDVVLLVRTKRKSTKDGYSDLYKSKNHTLSLDVNRLKDLGNGRAEYTGTLNLAFGGSSKTVKIHGVVDNTVK